MSGTARRLAADTFWKCKFRESSVSFLYHSNCPNCLIPAQHIEPALLLDDGWRLDGYSAYELALELGSPAPGILYWTAPDGFSLPRTPFAASKWILVGGIMSTSIKLVYSKT